MKQTAVIKSLRFVQMPITDCLFAVSSVANLPFRPIVPIAEQMDAQGTWVDLSVELDDAIENENQAREAQDTQGHSNTDPLLALAGTLECKTTKIDDTMSATMRGTNADQARESQVTDPLLALAGTLECKTTKIDDTMSATMRGTNADQARESQVTDPLLALAGTP